MSESKSIVPSPPPPAPVSSSSSKARIFVRRLASTVALWVVVLAAMFSGNRFLSDYVFLIILVGLAVAGLLEFYGLVEKEGMVCFKGMGVLGALLLMGGTFAKIQGVLGEFRT